MAATAPRPRPRSRRKKITLITAAAVFFIAISTILARWFSTENNERDDILAALVAQARGSTSGMFAVLAGCSTKPSCVAIVRENVQTLRRPGTVHILNLASPTAYALGRAFGLTRIAWSVPTRLPVVQCASVQRSGNIITGESVQVLSLSRPIGNTADCP